MTPVQLSQLSGYIAGPQKGKTGTVKLKQVPDIETSENPSRSGHSTRSNH